jgi:hypothetical protein
METPRSRAGYAAGFEFLKVDHMTIFYQGCRNPATPPMPRHAAPPEFEAKKIGLSTWAIKTRSKHHTKESIELIALVVF